MRTPVLALALGLAGCGPLANVLDGPCSSIDAEVVDDSVTPPANVALKLRVTCDGRALGSVLDGSAFELAEDGKVMSAYEADRMVRPVIRETRERVALVLDMSGSVTRSGLKAQMIAGARQLLDVLGQKQEVAIYGFDGRAELVPFVFFTDQRADLEKALDRVAEAGTVDDSTNLNGAVIGALKVLDEAVDLDGQVAHGTLVTFTDGTDRAGRVSDRELAYEMASTDHATFAIGVGAELDEDSLAVIGRNGRVIARDASELGSAFTTIGERVKAAAETDYLVSYCSPSRAGSRTLTITVRQGDLEDDVSMSFVADGFGAGCSPEAVSLR